jgi:hypothetical protein
MHRMRSTLALLFGRSDRAIDRAVYVKAGLSLMALKYLVDAALVGIFAGVIWTPFDYLVPMVAFTGEKVASFPRGLAIGLLIWTLPFIWIGVSLSVRRAMDARVFPGLVVLFFVPLMNYLMMVALAFAPRRRPEDTPSVPERFPSRYPAEPGSASAWSARGAQLGILLGALIGLIAGGVGVLALRTYGGTVFMGTPFLIGVISGYVANRAEERTSKETILIGQAALFAAGATLLFVAIEGAICLVMALPLASPIAMLGSMVGRLLAQSGRPPSYSHITVIFAALLLGTAIDAAMPAPGGRIVMTSIEVDAPAEIVWQHVTAFGDITEAPRWYFRTGLAYPLRARLEGTGAGAVRHCEFTTGAFVEPITVWDAPQRLAFDVVAQPPPLQEWSPYTRVYAPHLDGFFRTSHGEFRLVALGRGRTRLEGRTWYTLDMQPSMYWTALADSILHAVHDRYCGTSSSKQNGHPRAEVRPRRFAQERLQEGVTASLCPRRRARGRAGRWCARRCAGRRCR